MEKKKKKKVKEGEKEGEKHNKITKEEFVLHNSNLLKIYNTVYKNPDLEKLK